MRFLLATLLFSFACMGTTPLGCEKTEAILAETGAHERAVKALFSYLTEDIRGMTDEDLELYLAQPTLVNPVPFASQVNDTQRHVVGGAFQDELKGMSEEEKLRVWEVLRTGVKQFAQEKKEEREKREGVKKETAGLWAIVPSDEDFNTPMQKKSGHVNNLWGLEPMTDPKGKTFIRYVISDSGDKDTHYVLDISTGKSLKLPPGTEVSSLVSLPGGKVYALAWVWSARKSTYTVQLLDPKTGTVQSKVEADEGVSSAIHFRGSRHSFSSFLYKNPQGKLSVFQQWGRDAFQIDFGSQSSRRAYDKQGVGGFSAARSDSGKGAYALLLSHDGKTGRLTVRSLDGGFEQQIDIKMSFAGESNAATSLSNHAWFHVEKDGTVNVFAADKSDKLHRYIFKRGSPGYEQQDILIPTKFKAPSPSHKRFVGFVDAPNGNSDMVFATDEKHVYRWNYGDNKVTPVDSAAPDSDADFDFIYSVKGEPHLLQPRLSSWSNVPSTYYVTNLVSGTKVQMPANGIGEPEDSQNLVTLPDGRVVATSFQNGTLKTVQLYGPIPKPKGGGP